LGLLPSGPDPVGEQNACANLPGGYMVVSRWKGKCAGLTLCICSIISSAMTIKPIITLPNEKFLRQISAPVKSVDNDTRRLFDDMLETVYDAPGIGIAAIQIGVPLRAVVIDLAKDGEKPKPQFFANPEIISWSDDKSDHEEGCLSIPDFYEMVERPKQIKLRYLDRMGEPHEITASGLLATCLQHEVDHLNGILFVDHISKLKRDRVFKKFQKAHRLGRL
jgi:peptide deformylase